MPRIGSPITANSYNFDVVKEFIYLRAAINRNNDVSLAIKGRVTLANRCYFGLNRQLSSRPLSCDEINTPQSSQPTRALSSNDAAALGVFARKVLRKIFCPVRVGDDYRIRTNRKLFNHMDVAKRINNQRFRCLGHVIRMDEDASPRRVFDAVVGGHRRVG